MIQLPPPRPLTDAERHRLYDPVANAMAALRIAQRRWGTRGVDWKPITDGEHAAQAPAPEQTDPPTHEGAVLPPEGEPVLPPDAAPEEGR